MNLILKKIDFIKSIFYFEKSYKINKKSYKISKN